MDVTLVREKMFGFAQISRERLGSLEVRAGRCKVLMRERGSAQRQLRANVLSERAAFTAFPRLEPTAADKLGCFLVLPGLIVKGAKLNTEVIALLREVKPPGQFAQSPLRLLTKALPKLVALE
jgi:hypothetical protein